ncbi:MAG: hypothetical protein QM831_17285 [Kofleriaceae bacterium]
MRAIVLCTLCGCLANDAWDNRNNTACDDSFATLTLDVVDENGAPVTGLDHASILDSSADVSPTTPFDSGNHYEVIDDSALPLLTAAPHGLEVQFSLGSSALITNNFVQSDAHHCHVQWTLPPDAATWPN